MAKINHLEMGADVLALQDVQVKKGFMGLTVKLIYQPTNSVIKINRKDSRSFRSVVLVISQFRDRGQNKSSVPLLFYRYRMKSRFIPSSQLR